MNKTSVKSYALIAVYALYFLASNTAYYCYGSNNHFEIEYLFSAECCEVVLCEAAVSCSDAACSEGANKGKNDCGDCEDIPIAIEILSSNENDLSALEMMRYPEMVAYAAIDFSVYSTPLCSNKMVIPPPIASFKSIQATILRL